MHIKSILRSPDAEGISGGGQGANPFAPSNTPASEPSQQAPIAPASSPEVTSPSKDTDVGTGTGRQVPVTPTQAPTLTPSPSAPPQVVMSEQQLQSILAARNQPAAAQSQGQPQMSDDEFRSQFNIYTATEQTFENTFGVKPTPNQLAAYNDHLQAIARQAVTINRYLMDQKVSELRQQIQPVQQTFQEQRAQQHFSDFVGEYPGLKDYGPLLKEITDAAKARGMSFNNVGEAKNFVAAQAAKLLGKNVNDFKLAVAQTGGTPNQTTSQQSGTRPMSTTSMGGRSGSSGGAAPTQTTAERLFTPTS